MRVNAAGGVRLGFAAALLAGCSAYGVVETDAPLRALVVADLNGPYGSTEYASTVTGALQGAVESFRPDLVIVAGDLIAGQSADLPDARVREMWAVFDSAVAAPLREAGVPLVIALGNHDASAYPAHARDRRLALEYWRGRVPPQLPLIDAAAFPLRYTARFEDVFVVVWDATRQESGEEEVLLRWLREALKSPAARSASHRIVVGHLPLYPVAEGRERPGEFLMNGDSLRRELERLGATMFVSGHHHAFYPGRRGSLTLLHAGALGSGPRRLLGDPSPPRNALALVDFFPDSVSIRGYQVGSAGDMRPIVLESLPHVICFGDSRVVRIDVEDPAAPCGAAPTTREYFRILEVGTGSEYLHEFLAFYRAQIRRSIDPISRADMPDRLTHVLRLHRAAAPGITLVR